MSHTVTCYIGEDTACTVIFDYQPEEKATLTDPGCEDDVEITVVEVDGDNVIGDLNETCLSRLKLECFETVEDLASC